MSAQRASARTVVVGAGTVGAFVAYGLARRGEEVLLLERKEPGLEAAGLNAGTLAVQNKLLSLIPLAMRGVELWQDFERQTRRDLHTVRCGGFRVAHTTVGGERLKREAEQQRRLGLEVEHLSGEEARARAPYLADTVRAANWCPLDGHNNALTAVKQVVQEAEALGARVQSRSEVLRIEREAGRWRLVTPGGSVGADRVVLAAGLWSRTLAEGIGLRLQLEVHNNQMIVTERLPRLIDHVITHVTGRLTLKQKGEGTVLIGGGWPGHHDLENNLKWPALPSLIGNARLATATVPGLEDAHVLRTWAGLDGRTRSQHPLIGPVAGRRGLYLATSFRAAYTLGPAVGEGIAEWIVSGEPPELFAPFAEETRRLVASA